jgi:hypothetical protein
LEDKRGKLIPAANLTAYAIISFIALWVIGAEFPPCPIIGFKDYPAIFYSTYFSACSILQNLVCHFRLLCCLGLTRVV